MDQLEQKPSDSALLPTITERNQARAGRDLAKRIAKRVQDERDEARRWACRLMRERDEARGELDAIQQLAEDAVNTESWLLGLRLRQRLLAFAEKGDTATYDPHEVATIGYEVDRGGDSD